MKPATAECAEPALVPAFLASLGLLRRRPFVLPALGAAIVLSLSSVCCAIGLCTTPWFMCELFAAQLALCTGQTFIHSRAWLPAGMILLGAVLLVMGVAALTLVGTGPELPPDVGQLTGLGTLLRSGGFFAAASGILALVVLVPVLYAPLVLIQRETSFEEALLESVRMVVRRGLLSSLGLSLTVNLVQVSPLLAAAGWALIGARSQVPQALVIAAPLLMLSVPLGQGMIVWTYARLHAAHSSPPALPASPRTAAPLRSISRWTRGWVMLASLPIVCLLGLGFSLLRPSSLAPGSAPRDGEVIGEVVPEAGKTRRVALDNTSLELSATPDSVSIVAADGGGTGQLGLHDPGPISKVKVVRVRDAFAIEVQQRETASLTWIDRAGVRLDDDLRARLVDRVDLR
ncbi:MAG TPA: hypothetical protein VJV78_24680, partial [Polyangiales bacterium]|nr:hypothetical protein [Polyangiales bacterium]